MFYKLLNPDCVDVWVGNGWEAWSRFEIKRIKGHVFLNKVGGRHMQPEAYKVLCQRLEKV